MRGRHGFFPGHRRHLQRLLGQPVYAGLDAPRLLTLLAGIRVRLAGLRILSATTFNPRPAYL